MQNQRSVAHRAIFAPGIGMLILMLTAVAANASPIASPHEIDCDASNTVILNDEHVSRAHTSRLVTLGAGEALEVIFETVAGPFGSLTLVAGPGSPRQLLAGPTGTTVRFVAPERGTFGFEFATQGEAKAAFTVTCAPAAEQADTQEDPSASQRAARLLAQAPDLRALPEPEIPNYSIDPGPWSFAGNNRLAGFTVPGTQRNEATRTTGPLKPPLDVWLQAKDKRYSLILPEQPQDDSNAATVSGGGLNYKVLPQIMVGALVQFDQPGGPDKGAPRNLSDQGWMAGPMTAIQLAPGISLDARAAWGESTPATSYWAASNPGAERRLVNARLANTHTFGQWRFSPSVAINYFEETRSPADPSMHDGLAPTTVGSGRVDIRPELSYRVDLDGSTFIEPKAVVSGFWDIDSLSRLSPGSSGQEDLRLKAEAGLTVGTATGTRIQAMGAVEEGSAGASDTWSGRLQFSVPLK